ncbi:outer membrane protein assembly factor BamA [bacterium]|nr:outer membrane protein assembly factor BamA [bacterium]
MKRRLKCILPLLILLPASLMSAAEKDVTDFAVEKVRFEGNQQIKAKQLRSAMITRPSTLLNKNPYRPQLLKEDMQYVERYYKDRGFLQAKVIGYDVRIDTSATDVFITVQVEEGNRTFVRSVEFEGNTVFSDERLARVLKLSPGDPLLQLRIDDGMVAMLADYADNGYVHANVEERVTVDSSAREADVKLIFEEGAQYFVDSVRVKGLEITQPFVVRREIRLEPGDSLNYSRMLRSQRELYRTGLFQSVFIKYQPPQSRRGDTKDIIVELEEMDPIELQLTAGYGSVVQVRGGAEIAHRNLLRRGLTARLRTEGSTIGYRIESSLTLPWTFGYDWASSVSGLQEYRIEPNYDYRSTGGKYSLTHDFSMDIRLAGNYQMEYTELLKVKTQEPPEDINTNTRRVEAALTIDKRNDLFNPTMGWYFDARQELVGYYLGGTNDFVKVVHEWKWYHTIQSGTVIATRIEAGWADSPYGLIDIPLNERFYAGGPYSVRGYSLQGIGPRDSEGVVVGGRAKLVWNVLELRQTIWRWIGTAAFFDIGQVWAKSHRLTNQSLLTSPGIGLRVNTPVGLVRVDAAVPSHEMRFKKIKLWFGVGQTF